MSIGNSILNMMYGNPLGRLTGGPQALPGNQQGQGSSGQPVGPQQAPVASGTPSAAPSSPPDLANLYMQLAQRQQAAQGIDQGLRTMAAANSTPTMARALMSQQSPQGMDIGTMLQMMQYQRQMAGYQQLMAGIPDIAKISGLSPQTLQGIAMTNPDAYTKIVETYGGVGGGQDQDYMRAMAKARAAHPDMSNQQIMQTQPWLTNATTFNKTTQDAAEAKANAMESYPALSEVAKDTQAKTDWLADPTNRQAVQLAIANPGWSSANVAKWKGLIPAGLQPDAMSDAVTTARNNINWLKARLQTSEFAGTKNVRSVTEFNNLGATATNLDNATMANDPNALASELDRLQGNSWRESANLEAEAGKPVDAQYAGLADRQYFNPEHPFYNGATEGQLKPMPPDMQLEARAAIAKNPLNRHSIIMQAREQGFDPRGL